MRFDLSPDDLVRGLRSRQGVLILLVVASLATACSGIRKVNPPLDQVKPGYGYRPNDAEQHRDSGKIWLVLAFSGGGTRAAAYAYGVLEALRDTEIVVDGERKRLLDEVDTVSGVSGGSFPAAYYGLFGDRIFEEFEERFLNRNVQGSLLLRALNPWNLLRLFTPYLSRSDLAAQYYHKHVFDGATFEDLAEVHGARVHINATDLPSGFNFRFNQDAFDAICSDLNQLSIAYAVAASSAVPVLLSPITLENYAGTCGYEPPAWFEDALDSRNTNPRGHRAAKAASMLLDAETKKYIHLVDGGISDNLGIRLSLDRIAAIGSVEKARQLEGLAVPDHLVVVIVNAETEPDPIIDLKAKAPSVSASLNLVSGSQIRRYNFESLLLTQEAVQRFAATLSKHGKPVTGRVVEVSFDALEDEKEGQYLKRLPTSFALTSEQVDRLRAAGRRAVQESPQLQELLDILR